MPIPSLPQLPGEAASTGHKASGLLLTRLTRPRPPPGAAKMILLPGKAWDPRGRPNEPAAPPGPGGKKIGCGEQTSRALFPHARTGTWKMWKSRLLWRTGAREPPANRNDGRSFHIRDQVCTGVFGPLVGCVGNMGRVGANPDRISKTPEFERSDLENPSKS
jgi:hypothetical protein